jgi:hypothetical protein
MSFLKNMLIVINITLFGLGSFLCFTVAVVESQDRFLVGGVFLLLFTFVNQKIIYKVFE